MTKPKNSQEARRQLIEFLDYFDGFQAQFAVPYFLDGVECTIVPKAQYNTLMKIVRIMLTNSNDKAVKRNDD